MRYGHGRTVQVRVPVESLDALKRRAEAEGRSLTRVLGDLIDTMDEMAGMEDLLTGLHAKRATVTTTEF